MFDEPIFADDDDFDDIPLTLETFVYCSRAAESVDAAEVNRLVAFSQNRNAARGITGVLVFGSGVFFQWIEGPPEAVKALIANLHSDSRHHDIVTLDQSIETRERLYPHWEMEQVDVGDIRSVLLEALEGAQDDSNKAALGRILAHLESEPLQSFGRG